jgi:hypothetical protein
MCTNGQLGVNLGPVIGSQFFSGFWSNPIPKSKKVGYSYPGKIHRKLDFCWILIGLDWIF